MLTGTITKIFPVENIQGKQGTLTKQAFLLKTDGQYPKQVYMTRWGKSIDQYDLSEGEKVTVSFDIESREWQGKWYTDVKVWKVESAGHPMQQPDARVAPVTKHEPVYGQKSQAEHKNTAGINDGTNDLPF